jgi:hypothetical protein
MGSDRSLTRFKRRYRWLRCQQKILALHLLHLFGTHLCIPAHARRRVLFCLALAGIRRYYQAPALARNQVVLGLCGAHFAEETVHFGLQVVGACGQFDDPSTDVANCGSAAFCGLLNRADLLRRACRIPSCGLNTSCNFASEGALLIDS